MEAKTSIKNAELLAEYLKFAKKRRIKLSIFAKKYEKKKEIVK